MILDEVFIFLKTAGYARNHAAFSTDFLGHSPRYFDYLRCSGAHPSLRSLLKLVISLQDISAVKAGEPVEVTAANLARRVMSNALLRCR